MIHNGNISSDMMGGGETVTNQTVIPTRSTGSPALVESNAISLRKSAIIRVLRLPLMIMIVFMHCTLSCMQNGEVSDIIQSLFSKDIPSFAVPLFMFISGFLFFAKKKQVNVDFWTYQYHRRFHSLVIPYILWNVIVMTFFYIVHKFFPNIINPEFENVQSFPISQLLNCFWSGSGGFPIAYQFWFIRNLIVLVICTPLLYIILKNKLTSYVYGLTLLICTLLGVGNSWSITLLYFSLGIYVSLHNIDFTSIDAKYRYMLLTSSIICILIWICGYHSKLIKLLYILTISEYILSSRFLLTSNTFNKLMNKFANTSFFIFSFHGILALIFCKIIDTQCHVSNEILCILIYFINVILVVSICIVIYTNLKRFCPKLLSILTGGR